jgi:starvation-inducible DNA-binding protein
MTAPAFTDSDRAARKPADQPSVRMPNNRRRSTQGLAVTASAGLSDALQTILVDLIELHLQSKQAHWNVVGTNFRDLHLQLDQVVDIAREGADVIAERMRALNVDPDGRTDTLAATTTLPAFPSGEQSTTTTIALVGGRIAAATATIRDRRDAIDKEDPATTDLLHGLIIDLEKQAWMLASEDKRGAQAE